MAKVGEREACFLKEYLVDLNPTQAAIRAGYTPATAKEAYRWIKPGDDREKPRLRARIDRALAERSRRTGVSADRVVREWARVAFADITQVVDTRTGAVLPTASSDDLAAIASIKVKSSEGSTEFEVKLNDKLKALEQLGRHLGMFTDRVALIDDRPMIVDNIPGDGGAGAGTGEENA